MLPIFSGTSIVLVPTRTAYRMPHSDPPAIRPELNKVPAPTSDSAAAPVFRSTNARTRPPAKIGAVVAIGRYEPTANDKDRMPHSSSVTETNTPTSTTPQGRFWVSKALMIVD